MMKEYFLVLYFLRFRVKDSIYIYGKYEIWVIFKDLILSRGVDYFELSYFNKFYYCFVINVYFYFSR